MNNTVSSLWPGLRLAGLIAGLGLALANLPGFAHLGALTSTLLLGLTWRAVRGPSPACDAGGAFATKTLLRAGIILLGVRLNFALIAHAGPKILLLDLAVIAGGLTGISWLGRRLGVDPVSACLIAVDSSICGASAVAAAAPMLRAREDQIALVIPLCSLVGTAAMLGFSLLQHFSPVAPATYGLLIGATLHEVAHVMAAVHSVPAAVEIGTMTKLTRVVLLIPIVFLLGWWPARRLRGGSTTDRVPLPRPWFVLGFLGVGIINTLAVHMFPTHANTLATIDRAVLTLSLFLLSMAMAGMGLQVDLARFLVNGRPMLVTAVLGWCGLAAFAAAALLLLGP